LRGRWDRREPGLKDDGDAVEPRHRDCAACVEDDEGARVGLGNGFDERVLIIGQVEVASGPCLRQPAC